MTTAIEMGTTRTGEPGLIDLADQGVFACHDVVRVQAEERGRERLPLHRVAPLRRVERHPGLLGGPLLQPGQR